MKTRNIAVVAGAAVLGAAVIGVAVWGGPKTVPTIPQPSPTASTGATGSVTATGSRISSTQPPGTTTRSAGGSSSSQSASGAQAPGQTAPSNPVTEKKLLASITVPPPKTLAFVEPKAVTAGSKYAVTFVPYGYGPGGKNRTLVVHVTRSQPVGSVKDAYALTDRNVLLDVTGIPAARAISRGGTYSGTIVFVASGGMLAPRLVAVR